MSETASADVVVAGAGMAGLTAAVDLAEQGRDVLVVEKGDDPGGSMRISNGVVWTFQEYEALRERVPQGDPELQRLVAENVADDLDWLAAGGAELSTVEFDVPGSGRQIDPEAFTDHMVERLTHLEGRLQLATPLDRLVVEDGTVVGVEATTTDGDRLRIRCGAVVLATGGFQGNEKLVEQHITTATENLYLRSNPWSTGDGLLAALEAGGKSTAGLATFYGHTMAAQPAAIEPATFADATQYYGYAAVALDRGGRRFTDESESDLEETVTQDVAKMADGHAYYVFDDTITDRKFGTKTAAEIVATADELGGRTAIAETLEDVARILDEWGADGRNAEKTLRAYNEAIQEGRQPSPPRRAERHTVEEPPFRVVEVHPAITFTMGGLDVTTSMAVKRRSASRSGLIRGASEGDSGHDDATIPGLFAGGVDAGGFHRRTYIGGLAVGLVSGRVAASGVATYLDAAGGEEGL